MPTVTVAIAAGPASARSVPPCGSLRGQRSGGAARRAPGLIVEGRHSRGVDFYYLVCLLAGAIPALSVVLLAALVGFVGYGISLALFVLALRHLGSACTAAYFSTAPFLGALAAVALLHEPVTVQLLAVGLLMGMGVWLHLAEHHSHEHEHESPSARA
jgi:threonine/homoserine efflux transporter RhtA